LIAVRNYLDPASAGLSPEKYEAIGESNHETTDSSKKEVDAADIEVGYDAFGQPVAAIVTACEADKKASLWETIKKHFRSNPVVGPIRRDTADSIGAAGHGVTGGTCEGNRGVRIG
jgi:hypothetical protein